jgi:hypothetical protein
VPRNLFGAAKAAKPAPTDKTKKRRRRKPAPKNTPAKKPLEARPEAVQVRTPSAVEEGLLLPLQGPDQPPLMAVDVAALQRSCPRLDAKDLSTLRAEAAAQEEADPYTPAPWIDPWCSDPSGTFTLYSRFDRTWPPDAYFRPTEEQRNALRRNTIRNLKRHLTVTQWLWNQRYTSPAFTFWQYHVRYARQNFFVEGLQGEAFDAMCRQTFSYICEEWFEPPWLTNQGDLLFSEETVPKGFQRFMEAMELDTIDWCPRVFDAQAEQNMRSFGGHNPNPYTYATRLEGYIPQIIDRSKRIDATNITWVAPPEPLQPDPHRILRKQKRKNDHLTRHALQVNIHLFLRDQGPLALRLLQWLSQQTAPEADTLKGRTFKGHQGFKGRLGDLAAQADVTMELLEHFAHPARIAWPRDTDFKKALFNCNTSGAWSSQHQNIPDDWKTRSRHERQQTEVDFALCWHHTRWAEVIDPDLLAWSTEQPADATAPELWLSCFLFLVDMDRQEWDATHLDDKAALWIEHTRPYPLDGEDPVLDAELDPYDPRFQGMDNYVHDLHPDFVAKDYSADDGLRAFLATHPCSQELADRIRLVQDVADAMHQFDAAKDVAKDAEAAAAIRDHVEAALPYLSADAEGLLRTARSVRFATHPEDA